MNTKKIFTVVFAVMVLLGVTLSAQSGPEQGPERHGPHPGFGPMGEGLDNFPVGTTLTQEVKKLSGQALFSDRLIPVFAANGIEYEIRLPPLAFSGSNLKQGDTLEVQGIFSTLKTPDGKTINWVKPFIVKVGGKEIKLHHGWGNREHPHFRAEGGLAPGMGPAVQGKPDDNQP